MPSGLTVEKLERWIAEAEPGKLRHTAAVIERNSLLPAARLLRLADMQIAGALMQLPLEALRSFSDRFKRYGWRRASSGTPTPVITLRIEASTGALRVLTPDPRLLARQLLRHCVASLRGLRLPSEDAAFEGWLEEPFLAQGTDAVVLGGARRGAGSPRRRATGRRGRGAGSARHVGAAEEEEQRRHAAERTTAASSGDGGGSQGGVADRRRRGARMARPRHRPRRRATHIEAAPATPTRSPCISNRRVATAGRRPPASARRARRYTRPSRPPAAVFHRQC